MTSDYRLDRPPVRRPRQGMFVILALAATGSDAAAVRTPDRFLAAESVAQRAISDGKTPSIAIAVAENGKIVWEQGYGWADRDRRIPATHVTPYSLASISKPITATALMTLVQAGKIRLDDPVNQYLGSAKIRASSAGADAVTIRQLLNHTSGLPRFLQYHFADEGDATPSTEKAIGRYADIVTPPGDSYDYSNLGYGVLGHVIARTTGTTYEKYVERSVTRPLGLTTMQAGTAANTAMAAKRYDDAGAALPFYETAHPAASAIFASAHDLVKFGMFHLKHTLPGGTQVLSDDNIDAMHVPTAVIDDNIGYGLGWRVHRRADGNEVVAHTGSMPGVSTILMLVPDRDVVLVVLLNAKSVAARDAVVDSVIAAILPKWTPGSVWPTETSTPFVATPALAGQWTSTISTYEQAVPMAVRIEPSGAVLVALGKNQEVEASDVRLANGWLTGRAAVSLPTSDARSRRLETITFRLQQRDSTLIGHVAAVADEPRPAYLSHRVVLRRE